MITFTDGIKKIIYQTPCKFLDFEELSRDTQNSLVSQLILSDDDRERGVKNTFELELEFYKDITNLDSRYKKYGLIIGLLVHATWKNHVSVKRRRIK